jgi:hypothetical protein
VAAAVCLPDCGFASFRRGENGFSRETRRISGREIHIIWVKEVARSGAGQARKGECFMRRLLLIACITLIHAGATNAQGYLYTGLGPRIGLAVVDDYGAGFNAGMHADVAFDIGVAGELHYVPMIDFWFASDDEPGFDRRVFEIDFNLFDFRYYFPVPIDLFVKPYGGFAPAIVLDIYTEDFDNSSIDDNTDSEADFGFNMYGGADFIISPSFILFGEVRGKFGAEDLAKMIFGMTFPVHGAR